MTYWYPIDTDDIGWKRGRQGDKHHQGQDAMQPGVICVRDLWVENGYVQKCPEAFYVLLRNFKTTINRTGTKTLAGQINYLFMMLCGEVLRDFDKLASQNNGTMNDHLKHTQEGLSGCFFPINSLSKHKRTMRQAMSKYQHLLSRDSPHN